MSRHAGRDVNDDTLTGKGGRLPDGPLLLFEDLKHKHRGMRFEVGEVEGLKVHV